MKIGQSFRCAEENTDTEVCMWNCLYDGVEEWLFLNSCKAVVYDT